MTADAHRELRELLGAYAVSALTPDEEARVLAHLDGCAECRELLAELQPVAHALTAVDPAQLNAAPPATGPVEPLLAHVGGELARRRRRRRLVALGSGAAAVAAAALLAVAVIPSGDPAAPPAPERPLRSASAGVTGSVAILDRFWGTQLTLRAKGLPDREPIVIWVERRGGQRVPAGTLVGLGATPIKAQLGASVRVGDAIAVGVSDDAGRVLLSAPVRG